MVLATCVVAITAQNIEEDTVCYLKIKTYTDSQCYYMSNQVQNYVPLNTCF